MSPKPLELDEHDNALLAAFKEDAAKEEEWLRAWHGPDEQAAEETGKRIANT